MRCCDCCNLRRNQRTSQIVGIPNKQKKQTHHVIATTLAMHRVPAVSRSSKSPLSSHLLRHSHRTVKHCSLCHIAIQTSKNPLLFPVTRRITAKATPRPPACPSQKKQEGSHIKHSLWCVRCTCCGVVRALRCGKVWKALMLLACTVVWVPYTMTRWDTVW